MRGKASCALQFSRFWLQCYVRAVSLFRERPHAAIFLNFKAVEKRVSDGTIILVTGIAGSAGEIDHVDIRRNNDVVDVHIFVELTRNSTPIGPDHRTGVLKESIYVPDSANVVLLAGDGSVIWRRPVKAKRYEG